MNFKTFTAMLLRDARVARRNAIQLRSTDPAAIALARRVGPSLDNAALAAALNQAGHRTGTGQPFDGVAAANLRHYHQAVDALAEADKAWLASLITRRVPLHRAREAFTPEPDDVKVVITFDDDTPVAIDPVAITSGLTNAAGQTETANLDVDGQVENNVGADGMGSVQFASGTAARSSTCRPARRPT